MREVAKHLHLAVNGKTTSGSGIGLTVVCELVSAHGGTAAVASEPGRGSIFTVRLPQAPSGHIERRPAAVSGER